MCVRAAASSIRRTTFLPPITAEGHRPLTLTPDPDPDLTLTTGPDPDPSGALDPNPDPNPNPNPNPNQVDGYMNAGNRQCYALQCLGNSLRKVRP